MNAKFDASEQKLVNHALNCMARFDDKITIHCRVPDNQRRTELIRISAISPTLTAFCAFHFYQGFFNEYTIEAQDNRIDIRVSVKAFQAALKGQVNKRTTFCELQIIDDVRECRLAVRLHGAKGTVKTHKLTYEACAGQLPKQISSPKNHLIASPKTIQSLLDFFSSRTHGEIIMTCTRQYCSLSSGDLTVTEATAAATSSDTAAKASLQTQVRIDRQSFIKYEIGHQVSLTFSLKEFRAPVSLADHLQLPMEISFSQANDPLHAIIRMQEVMSEVFIATSAAEGNIPAVQGARPDVTHDAVNATYPSLEEGSKAQLESGQNGQINQQNENDQQEELLQSDTNKNQNFQDEFDDEMFLRAAESEDALSQTIATQTRTNEEEEEPNDDNESLPASSPKVPFTTNKDETEELPSTQQRLEGNDSVQSESRSAKRNKYTPLF